MIVETSAFVAIALNEHTRPDLEERLLRADAPLFPVHCLVEAHCVLQSRVGEQVVSRIERLIETFHLQLLPLSPAHAAGARDGFDSYGKGRHPARLNYGDCLSYGVAKAEEKALLFVGEDFAKTDISAAG